MADTGKQVRVSRTNFGGGLAQGGLPSERSQLVGQTVHQYRSESEGLESLNAAIGNFVNAAIGGIEAVNNGVLAGQRARIEQENAAQKRQALGDALLGKDMDQTLADDLDYYDAFRSVRAQRDAYEAFNEFNKFYLEEWLPGNPTGDLEEARRTWAASNLLGSDDPDYEGQVLANFFQQTDQMVPRHMEFALKWQTTKGIETLGQAIDASVATGTLTPGSLANFFDQAVALDPLNASEARGRVVSALLASAQNHPENLLQVASLLSKEGTGVNGKSFMQSFPEAYAEFQSKAVSAWNAIKTAEQHAMIVGLEDRVRAASTVEELADVASDALIFRDKYGAHSAVEQILNSVSSRLDKVSEQMVIVDGLNAFLAGDPAALPPSEVVKAFTPWMEQTFGTRAFMAIEPARQLDIVRGLHGVVPPELKVQLSSALMNTSNPDQQTQTIKLLNSLTEETSPAYAKDFLDPAAYQLYQSVYRLSALSAAPMEVLLQHASNAMSAIDSTEVDWMTLTGAKDETKAREAVRKVLDPALSEAFGVGGFVGIGRKEIDYSSIMGDVLDVARLEAIRTSAVGLGWEQGVKDFVADMAAHAEVVPGVNGKLILRPKGRTGNPMAEKLIFDDEGNETQRVPLGLNVVNPTTLRPVNTVEVFKQDLRSLGEKARWATVDGSTDTMSLNHIVPPHLEARGLFPVMNGGIPVVFSAGDEVTVPGPDGETTIKLPANEAELAASNIELPPGFRLYPLKDPINGTAWQLTYRPHFGDQAGKTLDQREAEFIAPPARPPSLESLGSGGPLPFGLGVFDPVYN